MGTEFESHSGVKEPERSPKHLRLISEKEGESPLRCPVCQSTDLKLEALDKGTLIRCQPNGHYSLVD